MEAILSPFIHDGLMDWNRSGEELRSIRKQQTKKVDNDPFYFRASQVGHCMAQLSFDWRHPQRTRDVPGTDSLATMHLGEVFGQCMVNLLNRSGIKVRGKEVYGKRRFQVEHNVITLDGHVDIVAEFLDGVTRPIEVKLMGERSFSYMRSDDDPYEAHEDQLRAYMELLDSEEGILIVRQASGPMAEFVLKRSKKKWGVVLNRLHKIGLARSSNNISTREYTDGEPPCTFCRHNKVCWGAKPKKRGKGSTDFPEIPVIESDEESVVKGYESWKEAEAKAKALETTFKDSAERLWVEYNSDTVDIRLGEGRNFRAKKVHVSTVRESVPKPIMDQLREEKKLTLTPLEYFQRRLMKIK